MRKSIYAIMTAFLFGIVFGCDLQKEVVCSGRTMGTTYRVTVVTSMFRPIGSLQSLIDSRLEEINRSMSTFLPDSEISRFNALKNIDEAQAVSDDFWSVVKAAKNLYQISDGALDGTVMPLVDLWGFGPDGFTGKVPDAGDIERCLKSVGFSGIEMREGQFLVKSKADIQLDLAAIAKGYGVDALAKLLLDRGFTDFIVEVGGEVFAAGVRKDGKRWRVGINLPNADAAFNEVYHVVALEGKAMATSGDYRNFFELDGCRYAHIIDPRSGYPVSNGVVSASVIADNCTLADGLATAMVVMGAEKALVLANQLTGVSCLVVVREADGTLSDYRSDGFMLED